MCLLSLCALQGSNMVVRLDSQCLCHWTSSPAQSSLGFREGTCRITKRGGTACQATGIHILQRGPVKPYPWPLVTWMRAWL